MLPEELEKRITFLDVIRLIAEQTGGLFREEDFMPLPCAHPNCHSLAYAYRSGGKVLPLLRFIDARNNLDLLANGVTFNRLRARQLIERYLGKLACCGGDCGTGPPPNEQSAAAITQSSAAQFAELPFLDASLSQTIGGNGQQDITATARDFFARALAEELSPSDVFRITITSLLDAYNFDVRRVMKCCIHHVLPSGHVIPCCAYNVLYREGHVTLPPLQTLETLST